MRDHIEKFIGDTMLYFVSAMCELIYMAMALWGKIIRNEDIVKLSEGALKDQNEANAEYERKCEEFIANRKINSKKGRM